ncbi:MAG TPA: DUF4013 domain-containing protein [Candidatus Obscuribacterales bacterium]
MSAKSPACGLNPDAIVKSFFQDPEWMFKTGVGGMLNATSLVLLSMTILLLPLSVLIWGIVTGYILRAARSEIASEESLPQWNDWPDLLISGLTWLAMVTGQVLVVFSVSSTLILFGLISGMLNATDPRYLAFSLASIYFLAIIFVSIAFTSYLLMINFAREERVPAALAVHVVMRKLALRPKDFFTAWLIGVGLQWLSIILPALTVIGLFFTPSTWFIAQVLSARLLAKAWKLADELSPLSA